MDSQSESVSGDWIGYYTYGDGQAHHTMELNLSLAGGLLSGRGIDDVGGFTISGTCSESACSWTKTYGTHSIEYEGSLDEGRIWGTWAAGWNRGGFMIWPRKRPGVETERESVVLIQIGESVPQLTTLRGGHGIH
jgi:hypothetical protein